MQKYTIRTTAPTKGNKWYTGTAYGGVSNCITSGKNFIARWQGSTMNNCVGGGHGRYFEAQAKNGAIFGRTSNEDIAKVFAWRKTGDSPADMWNSYKADKVWKNYCKSTPKQGAMAFYKRVSGSGYAGHMCVVEKVYDNGNVDFFNNNYSTKPLFSYQKNVNPNGNFGGNFKLLGYVWPIADFEGTTFTTTDALNCRVGAGKTMASLGVFPKGTKVTLAGDHKDLDGKVWKYVKGKTREGKTISGYVLMDYLK